MKSRRSLVWNPQLVAVWNHHEMMYVINPKAEKREYALKRDAMPSRSDGLHATRGAR